MLIIYNVLVQPQDVFEHPSLSLVPVASENKRLEQCAVDWSLKTRVRFTSRTKFTFSTTLKVNLKVHEIKSS